MTIPSANTTSKAPPPPPIDTSIEQPKQKKRQKPLGVYPAISLTSHQQVIVNFGQRPWLYPPPIAGQFRGISEAGELDPEYQRRVIKWVRKRGVTSHGRSYLPTNKQPLRPLVGADEITTPISDADTTDAENEEEGEDDDGDGTLCNICFSEPKDTVLLPCKHDGIGSRCAKILTSCPLCRATITDRVEAAPNA